MNYFSKLAFGVAALALAASCSNDEPAVNGGTQIPEGQQAFLRVNVQSAGEFSRSTVIGGYEYGDAQEHKVNNAHFFFFDANGIYVGTANIWKDGGPGNTPNIEYMGGNVIVLDNLTSNEYPNYVLTVLNKPTSFTPRAGQSAAEVTRELAEFGSLGAFVMSTSSYYTPAANVTADSHHNNAFPYLTKLNTTDFISKAVGTTPTDAEIAGATPVEIYVERLAAKVQLNVIADATITVDGNKLFKLDATIAGENNPELGNDPLAGQNIYVRIDGWDLNNTVNKSYIAKQLLPGWETTAPFDDWQPAYTDHRSFWAESYVYDANGAAPAASKFNARVSGNKLTVKVGDVAYCNENTNVPEAIGTGSGDAYTINPSLVTSVYVKATVTDKDNNPLDLIRHNGLLYTSKQFKLYLMGAMSANDDMKFYIQSVDAEGKTVYTQLGSTEAELSDFKLVSDGTVGGVKLDYAPAAEPEGLVKRTGGNATDGYTYAPAHVADVKSALVTFQANIKIESFENGMYYRIPVEHFANNGTDQMARDHEGYFGVVRNHWYKVNISNVLQLGHGIFDPDKEIVDTKEDPKENYFLVTRINILSWKVITQDVEI